MQVKSLSLCYLFLSTGKTYFTCPQFRTNNLEKGFSNFIVYQNQLYNLLSQTAGLHLQEVWAGGSHDTGLRSHCECPGIKHIDSQKSLCIMLAREATCMYMYTYTHNTHSSHTFSCHISCSKGDRNLESGFMFPK